jgi:hypothetical protein
MATIQEVYIALFGRPADPIGLRFYNEATDNGNNLDAVGDLTGSDEYLSRFEGQNDVQMINQIFQDLFGRDADAQGLLFYTALLQSGQASIQDIAIRIIDGATGSDQAIVDAKVAAANLFTASLDQGNEIVAYSGQEGIDFGQNYLDQVTSAATVPTQAEVDAQIAAFVVGDPDAPTTQTNFTAAVGEQLVGTAENNAFSGVVGTGGTVNVGDTVNGGAGVDTLNLLVSDATSLPAGFSSTGVEIVNINYAGATDLGALNSSTFGGVQQLWQIDNDTAAAGTFETVTVASGVTAGFRSTGNAATAAAATATVIAAAGSTSVAVALDGVLSGSAITFNESAANDLSTVTVSGSVVAASGAANTLDLISAGTAGAAPLPQDIDTLNLSLSSNTTVDISDFADITVLDASGSTGNVSITTLAAAVDLETATFGSGNNTITTSIAGLTAEAVSIDAGAGNDTVNLVLDNAAGASAVSVTLGAGDDRINLDITATGNLVAVGDADDLNESLVTITDFEAGDDFLDLTGLGASARTAQNLVDAALSAATVDDLFDAATAVANATAVDAISLFEFEGSTYVYYNTADVAGSNLDAGDVLVELAGVSVSELTAANFIV